jgi:hypothetical protein
METPYQIEMFNYLSDHSLEVNLLSVLHNGTAYSLNADARKPLASFICDRYNSGSKHVLDCQFQMIGAHTGPPINVWLTEVALGDNYDDDTGDWVSSSGSWKATLWVDDESPIAEVFVEAYEDVLREELTALLKED